MKVICRKEALETGGIDYLQGLSASKLDTDAGIVTLSDGRVLRYEKLLLAPGARPRKLTCPGAELALDFRTHADAEAIFSGVAAGRRVAIIGGGLIGMELASVLRGKDVAVSVIEAAPKPLGRAVPARFAEKLYARHAAEGVRFHLDRGVVAINDDGITLTDGTMVPADLVVSAIGVLPEIALAETAGLATGNGILTDPCLRTNAPNVFAAGDCAAVAQPGGGYIRYESWRNARMQAETAARNMAGAAETFTTIPWFWSDQYDLGLQVAGLPRPAHQSVLRFLASGEVEFYLDDGRLVAAAGLGIGNSVAKDIKLAEMLIAAGISPYPAALADPGLNLKSLLEERAGRVMQKLLIFQSLWAMERRHTDGYERSLDENIAMISEAAFDGVSAHYTNRRDVVRLNETIQGTELKIEGVCFPRCIEDLRLPLELGAEFPVSHINLQPDIRPRRIEDCLPLLDGWMQLAEDAGIPVFIETHRDRMTTDLFFTLDLLDQRPELPLLADLSHFLVGREFVFPVDEENHALMQRIMRNAWAFHGRVASREQVQIEISYPHHRPWVELFLEWWEYGFRDWRNRAASDAELIFTCELGPKPYAITGSGWQRHDRPMGRGSVASADCA